LRLFSPVRRQPYIPQLVNRGGLSELGLQSSCALLAVSRDLIPWFITLIGVKPAGTLTDLQCSHPVFSCIIDS